MVKGVALGVIGMQQSNIFVTCQHRGTSARYKAVPYSLRTVLSAGVARSDRDMIC